MHSIAWQKLYHLNKTPLPQSDLHQLQAQRLEVPGIKFYAIIPRRNACCKKCAKLTMVQQLLIAKRDIR